MALAGARSGLSWGSCADSYCGIILPALSWSTSRGGRCTAHESVFSFFQLVVLRDRVVVQKATRQVDLLTLTPDTDVEVLVNQIVRQEPLVSEARKPQLRKLIYKLIEKMESHENQSFYLFKILRAHILPLTNCAFNKSGDRFITGSYDRTCKVWNTFTGEELLTLEGHKNVVYAIAFNNPFGDKVCRAICSRTVCYLFTTGSCTLRL